jgi:hypothetical protein
MFRPGRATKQFSGRMKPFSASGANIRKQRVVIKFPTKRRGAPAPKTGDSQMRTFSFILAFAFILAGPSLAGSSDNGLPGIGTFSYNGSPIVTSAPVLVAAN